MKKIFLFLTLISLFSIKIKANTNECIQANEKYIIDDYIVNIQVNINSEKECSDLTYEAIINKNFDIDRDTLNENVEIIENIDKTIKLIWKVDSNNLEYNLKLKDIVLEEINILDNSSVQYLKNNKKSKLNFEEEKYYMLESVNKEIVPPQTGESSIFFEIFTIIIISCIISVLLIPIHDKK